MAQCFRLRQICLVAHDLEKAAEDICAVLGIEVCHRDPNVGKYGLSNVLMPIGTSFLEVVAPNEPGHATAAGRYLERRRGDGGYMVINDCDDVAPFRQRAEALAIRRIAERSEPDKADLMQLHPRDTGGCILEIDHHVGGDALDGHYQWAGLHWQQHIRTDRVTAITGAEVQSDEPAALAARWSQVIGKPVDGNIDGTASIRLDNAVLRFARASDGRGEGLGGVSLAVKDKAAVLSSANARGLAVAADGSCVTVCGTRFYL